MKLTATRSPMAKIAHLSQNSQIWPDLTVLTQASVRRYESHCANVSHRFEHWSDLTVLTQVSDLCPWTSY